MSCRRRPASVHYQLLFGFRFACRDVALCEEQIVVVSGQDVWNAVIVGAHLHRFLQAGNIDGAVVRGHRKPEEYLE